MHTKTMEGLIGARTNMELLNTPIRVFKEARRKGDLATMERAMDYAGDFHEKAYEYKEEADKGMKEDAKEAREKAEEIRKEAALKRKEEQEKLEERIEESRQDGKETDGTVDTVTISEEGKVLLKENAATDSADLNPDDTTSEKTESPAKKDPVTYTNTGETSQTETPATISVSV